MGPITTTNSPRGSFRVKCLINSSAVPRTVSSNIFDISRDTEILLSPVYNFNSSSNFIMRKGDSYKIIVLSSSAIAFNLVCLPFLCGRKPMKTNSSVANPELIRAGTKAVAPGKHSTVIPAVMAAAIKICPGWECRVCLDHLLKQLFCPIGYFG